MNSRYCAYLVHAIHWVIFLGSIFSIAPIIAYSPWWISIPFLVLISNPSLSGSLCVLNNLENYYRREACMRLIDKDFLEIDMPYIIKFLQTIKLLKREDV
jgi:hypothetical protein